MVLNISSDGNGTAEGAGQNGGNAGTRIRPARDAHSRGVAAHLLPGAAARVGDAWQKRSGRSLVRGSGRRVVQTASDASVPKRVSGPRCAVLLQSLQGQADQRRRWLSDREYVPRRLESEVLQLRRGLTFPPEGRERLTGLHPPSTSWIGRSTMLVTSDDDIATLRKYRSLEASRSGSIL